MIPLRALNEEGLRVFSAWLDDPTQQFPSGLKDADAYTVPGFDRQIDEDRSFSTRYEFGLYLVEVLHGIDFHELRAAANDGLWAWLAVVYLAQLAPGKPKSREHYIVVRKAAKGSLAYRHDVRSAFELTHIHGEFALVCLSVPMHTWGEMSEQLAARQTLAHHRGFFRAAYALYIQEGRLRRGASSRPKKPRDRKPGDRAGFGGARRLALALRRLDLTFDTEIMHADGMIAVLPKEFRRWRTETRPTETA